VRRMRKFMCSDCDKIIDEKNVIWALKGYGYSGIIAPFCSKKCAQK
jgi:hypothetical protein